MKQLNFKIGEEVRLKSDRRNRYRYVGGNRVRKMGNGQIKAVPYSDIAALREPKPLLFTAIIITAFIVANIIIAVL